MARRLDYKPLQEDDKLAEVEIDGKTYTFPLPEGLSTDEAMHLVDLLDGGNLEQGDFFNLMREMFNGWLGKDVVDKMPLGDFLEKISRAGVTHHSSLVYNASLEELEFFGKLLGLNVVVVK
jgi:hypothetical protein